jgi:hypothetical protein
LIKNRFWLRGFIVLLGYITASVAVDLPDGFAVWSEGNGKDRTLMMRKLKSDGTMEDAVKVTDKGDKGGDIQSQISYDGKWLAFSRSMGGTGNSFGGDDYHSFGQFEIFIVSLTGSFPAPAIKVGRGYWPSWADNSFNAKKTLYYSTDHDSRTIRKVTIDEKGIVEGSNEVAQDLPKNAKEMVQMAPNGKFVTYRKSRQRIYFYEDWMGKKAGDDYLITPGKSSCHPSVLADSRWVIHAQKSIARVGKNGTNQLPKAGAYHYGTSQDLNWFITRPAGKSSTQNLGSEVNLFPVKIKGEEAKKYFNSDADLASTDYVPYGDGVAITKKGSWPDVHVNTAGPVGKSPFNGPSSAGKITFHMFPHQLIITNELIEPTHVAVTNVYGKKAGEFHNVTGRVSHLNFNRKLSTGFYLIHFKSPSNQKVIGRLLSD